MSSRNRPARAGLTDYEAQQVRRIAAWKSEPPNPFAELFKRITLPGARVVEKLIPDEVVRVALERAYDLSERIAGREDVERLAGVADVTEMRHRPLEECDRLANRIMTTSQALSLAEGAATGAGGPLTTVLDIPLLFVLSLRTILKIGHCYGYKLDGPRDRRYVLGVMVAATAGSLEVRRERLMQLHELEDWLLEEAQEEIIAEEAVSILFQLEVFEDVPGVGAVSGALLNLAFMRRVDLTARYVFQERWLRDHGKVDVIQPAETHARALEGGWTGALVRAAYSGGYAAGFGLSLPFYLVGSLFRPLDNPLTRGARDGATGAGADVDRLLDRARGAAGRGAPLPAAAPA